MLYLSRTDIEMIADRVLGAYMALPELQGKLILQIDPEKLLTNLLGLRIAYEHLSPDRCILGATCYEEAWLEVFENPEQELYCLDGKTVLIEKDLKEDPGQRGRLNFTLAHEGSHQIYHMLYPQACAAEAPAMRVLYDNANRREMDWGEWQADTLSAALLMPKSLILQNMHMVGLEGPIEILNRLWRKKEYGCFTTIADMMGVSKSALCLRMRRLGLIQRAYLRYPKDMCRVYMTPEEEDLYD